MNQFLEDGVWEEPAAIRSENTSGSYEATLSEELVPGTTDAVMELQRSTRALLDLRRGKSTKTKEFAESVQYRHHQLLESSFSMMFVNWWLQATNNAFLGTILLEFYTVEQFSSHGLKHLEANLLYLKYVPPTDCVESRDSGVVATLRLR